MYGFSPLNKYFHHLNKYFASIKTKKKIIEIKEIDKTKQKAREKISNSNLCEFFHGLLNDLHEQMIFRIAGIYVDFRLKVDITLVFILKF